MRSRTKVCPNNRLTPANVGESVGKSTVGRVAANITLALSARSEGPKAVGCLPNSGAWRLKSARRKNGVRMRLKPRVSNALRTAIATAALAVAVYAQSAPKPTLDSVDKQLKQSSTDQAADAARARDAVRAATAQATATAADAKTDRAAEAAQAKGDRARTSAAQAAVLDRVLLEQERAQLAALRDSKDTSDSVALAQYKQEQRMLAIELVLTQSDNDKKAAAVEAKRTHDELMSRASEITVGLLVMMVAWAVKAAYGLAVDGKRDRAEEKARSVAVSTATNQEAKLDQIHTLVNTTLTAAMHNEMDARKSSLASLEEIASLRHGEVSKAAFGAMETQRAKIGELEAQLDDRLKATRVPAEFRRLAIEEDLRAKQERSANAPAVQSK